MRRGNGDHGRDEALFLELANNGRALKVEALRRGTVKHVTWLRRFAQSKEWQRDMVRFCMDYVTAERLSGKRYPTGIPPLHALVRLVMQEEIAALTPDEYATHVHTVAAGFIAWLVFGFNQMFGAGPPRGEDALDTAASLLGLSWGEDFPETYQKAVFPGVNVQGLMGWSTLTDSLRSADPRRTSDIW